MEDLEETSERYSVTSLIKKLNFTNLQTNSEFRIDHSNQKEVEWKKVNDVEDYEEYEDLTENESLDLLPILKGLTENFSNVNMEKSPIEDDDDDSIYDLDNPSEKTQYFLLRETDIPKKKYTLSFEVLGILRYKTG